MSKHSGYLPAASVATLLVGALVLILSYIGSRFNWPWWILIPLISIGIALLIVLILVGYTAQWTGFRGGYDKVTTEIPSGQPPTKTATERQPRKTLWDWLQLLIIPVVLAGVTLGFGWWQANLAQQQHVNDQASANLQHIRDQQSALDQQQAAILQTYVGNIQDLLLNHNLSKSKPEDEIIRQVAREQTLTTLQRLDAKRNGVVLRFLQDAHLIGIQDAVINLSNADLSSDLLSGINLSGIDLIGVDLSNADLTGADLNGSILYGADLSNAHLSKADLSNALLSKANLTGVTLNNAHLSDTTLTGAFLGNAHLNGATLTGAHLNGTTLTGAFLSHAHLSNAHLSNATLTGAHLNGTTLSDADLTGADLSNADLSNADLTGATLNNLTKLTQQQLDKVSFCTSGTLSIGLTCHHRSSVVTLTYWYTEGPSETPVILHQIQLFERKYPNIKINPVNEPFLQTQAAFITAAQKDNAPDVLRSDIGWVTQFAKQGYLLNIDSYVSQSNLSDYLPTPLSYDKYNGHLYGLPQVTDFLALLYNKAEFKKAHIASPPTTMAEFEADAMKVMRSKAATYGFETDGTSYNMLPFLWAFGGGMFDQHNNILVNNPGSIAGLKFLLKLQNTDKVMPENVNFSKNSYTMVDDFMKGKTAMIFDGPWDVSKILTDSVFTGKTGNRNLGIIGIPKGDMATIRQFLGQKGRTGQTGSPLGGQSYVISVGTAHPAEAYKFISFMSSPDSQIAIAKANKTLPTRQSAYHDRGVSRDPFISAFLSIKKTAVARPVIPQGGLVFDVFDPNIEAALDGVESPPDALNAVADAWKQLLAGS